MIKKKCHIHAVFPVTCFIVPIVGHTDLNLTPDEIYQCLCAKAEVYEYLPNGSTVDLDFSNYNKDNSPKPVQVVPTLPVFDKVKVDKPDVEESVVIEEESKEETVIVVEDKVEVQEEVIVKEESPVRTHELSSRNNNQKYNNNNHKKSKNKR